MLSFLFGEEDKNLKALKRTLGILERDDEDGLSDEEKELLKVYNAAQQQQATSPTALNDVEGYWTNYNPTISLSPHLIPAEQYAASRTIIRAIRRYLLIKRTLHHVRMEREKKRRQAAIMIQKWIRGYRARKSTVAIQHSAAENAQLYTEFRQRVLSSQGITTKVFSKTRGTSQRRSLQIDKKREFLCYRPSILSGVRRIPLNSIYKVTSALSQEMKEAPEHAEWCLSVHTPSKILDIEALDEHQYLVLLTGFTKLELLLNRNGAFYVDEHGCMRRSGKSVLSESSFAIMSCAEQARMKDAKRALREYYESRSKERLRTRPKGATTAAGKPVARGKTGGIMFNGKSVQALASAPVRAVNVNTKPPSDADDDEEEEDDEEDEEEEGEKENGDESSQGESSEEGSDSDEDDSDETEDEEEDGSDSEDSNGESSAS